MNLKAILFFDVCFNIIIVWLEAHIFLQISSINTNLNIVADLFPT